MGHVSKMCAGGGVSKIIYGITEAMFRVSYSTDAASSSGPGSLCEGPLRKILCKRKTRHVYVIQSFECLTLDIV